MRLLRRLLSFGLVTLACLAASAAVAATRLFADQTPLQITLTAPFPALVRSAKTSQAPHAATLSVSEGGDAAQSYPIQVRARGLTRRTAGYCAFPPLWLDFGDARLRGTLFQGQEKLKLVTYCRPAADYEQRIILEYTAYRLYNVLTPMSFRVRAAQVTYRATDDDKGLTRFGFLLEDPDDVAGRNARDALQAMTYQVSIEQLDAHAAARAALFEYLIGNLDWDFLAAPAGTDCCHNSRLLAAPKATPATAREVVPVPYDYDFSGFVDSPYAGPPADLPIKRLTQRLYRGYCAHSGEIPSVLAEFRAHRTEMMALIDGETRLTGKFRDKAARFVDGFYEILDDPDRVQKQIVQHCRQRSGPSSSRP